MTSVSAGLRRRASIVAAISCLFLGLSAVGFAQATDSSHDPTSLLWPQPRLVQPRGELEILLPIQIVAADDLARPAALLHRELSALFGGEAVADSGRTVIHLALAPEALTRPEEYAVEPYEGGVMLWSHDVQGAFWAVHALATLLGQAEPAEDGYLASVPAVRDWPDTQFRSLMFQGAWVPTLEDYRRTLELMARMHITYVALEFGPQVVLDFDPSIAEFGRFSKEDARAVIDYARSLGLKPIGYLNMLGHLDRAYKKEPYTQHGGIDIRNDATYEEFVYPILDEMLDVYGPVEYFHCGMDEAWELFRWLSEEGYDVTSLLARHVKLVDDYLRARGVKLVIWHDMFIDRGLSDRIGGPAGPANGGPPQNTAAALALIPTDVILDYWFYDPLPAYPALDYLQEQGFEVWASPWETPFSFVRYAASRNAPTLGTMWSNPPECFGDPQSGPVFAFYAQAAWDPGVAGPEVTPEQGLKHAAQQATNGVMWRRRTLTRPSAKALILTPGGPRPSSEDDQLSYAVPLAREAAASIEPLSESTKPLDVSAGAARVRVIGGPDLVLDGVNTGRDRNQLILYAAPFEKTGTNGYGTEVLVGSDGTVLEVVGGRSGDNLVPPGGFVLSAHGWRGKGRLLRALHPGDRLAVLDARGRWIGGTEPIALSAELPGGEVLPIDGDDIAREADALVLYRPGYGEGSTGTDEDSIEIGASNGKIAFVNRGGDAAIPEDGYVLSLGLADGDRRAAALGALQPGDGIRLLLEKAGHRQYLDEAIEGRSRHFPIGARCDALYLAVSSGRRTAPGTPLGEWRVRYQDGTSASIPCRYGREAVSPEPESLPISVADPVWLVDEPGRHFLVDEWRNPDPGKVVDELVFAPKLAAFDVGARVIAATAAVE